jgi:hypothetical protein
VLAGREDLRIWITQSSLDKHFQGCGSIASEFLDAVAAADDDDNDNEDMVAIDYLFEIAVKGRLCSFLTEQLQVSWIGCG